MGYEENVSKLGNFIGEVIIQPNYNYNICWMSSFAIHIILDLFKINFYYQDRVLCSHPSSLGT